MNIRDEGRLRGYVETDRVRTHNIAGASNSKHRDRGVPPYYSLQILVMGSMTSSAFPHVIAGIRDAEVGSACKRRVTRT